MLELRHLRYFVAVAEERHFGRAAEKLGISQPPLSQQIRQMEDLMGVRLFDRSNRHVALSPAGRAFLPAAQAMLKNMASAVALAQRVARGETGELRVAFTSSAPFTVLVPRTIYDYRRSHPEVALHLSEMPSRMQLAALAEERLDAGFVRGPFDKLPEGLVLLPVLADRLMVALHVEHPLAGQVIEGMDEIDLGELAAESFVMFSANSGTGVRDHFLSLCAEAHFTPRIVQEAQEAATLLALVATGLGVTVLPDSLRRIRVPGVAYRPLTGASAVSALSLAYRGHEHSGPLPPFVALVRRLLQSVLSGL